MGHTVDDLNIIKKTDSKRHTVFNYSNRSLSYIQKIFNKSCFSSALSAAGLKKGWEMTKNTIKSCCSCQNGGLSNWVTCELRTPEIETEDGERQKENYYYY